MDLYERIIELSSMGYHCSQMIMILTLETIGEENPQLVKALGGLGGGIGYCGDTCGCLTGGACAIGLFLGNLAPQEKEDIQIQRLCRNYISGSIRRPKKSLVLFIVRTSLPIWIGELSWSNVLR